MDFIDSMRVLASRVAAAKDMIQTEEATKNAMIMPFIQLLGYNVFDPCEVTPELVSDVGTKKGEKVDYAILREGKPIILFECKKAGADLNVNHASQLFRYFHVTEARFGVLTNGLTYSFFTDLEQPNRMDTKPFFEFNILEFKERDIEELKRFTKNSFDLETILNTAEELKYTRAIQTRLAEWMANPSEDFVRLACAELIGRKKFTSTTKDQFTKLTRRAFEQLVGERINERLKVAMAPESLTVAGTTSSSKAEAADSTAAEVKVVTSLVELEAFHSVRSIIRDLVPSKRVAIRDSQSYCAVLLDDNNRKPICRLRFNNPQKLRLGIINSQKEEEQFSLETVDDIYNYTDRLRATVAMYLPSVTV